MVKVCLTRKWNQMKTCQSLFPWNWKMTPLPSLSRNHLPPTGPPRVCVLSRHLCVSPTPGGPLLGQTLPAAPWGPGADCQEGGCLERGGGQTCLLSHTVLSHENTHTHMVVIQESGAQAFWGRSSDQFGSQTNTFNQFSLIFPTRWPVLSKDCQDVKNTLLHLKQR